VIFLGALMLAALAPLHIPTWAYDEYWAQGAMATASDVERYVTYAEGGLGNDKAVKDCAATPKSCWSVWYFDPHLIHDSLLCPANPDSQFVAAASESWWVHESGYTDSAHRVMGTYQQYCKGAKIPIPTYEANIANPAVGAFFANYLRTNASAWNYYFMDDAGATLVDQMYGPTGGMCRHSIPNGWCRTTQEIPNDAALLQDQAQFLAMLRRADGTPMQFFVNGNPTLLQTSEQYLGAVCENCIVDLGSFRPASYARILTTIVNVERMGRKYVILNTGDAPAGSNTQIEQRLVTTAIAWLGYREGQTIVWPNLEYNTNNLAVWPEDEIVPTEPLESASSSSNDIAVAPNVWRRDFTECYEAGKTIGPCAALLNANSNPVAVQPSWLKIAFKHVIQLQGGDILSNGSLVLSSTPLVPNETSIPAGGALLLDR
jgi:hypothetical protein